MAAGDDFLDALERVGAGGTALDPRWYASCWPAPPADPLARLTPRERDVLERMAEGLTNASIAQAMHVSTSAVEKHVNSLFDKLGLSHHTGYSRRVLAVLRFLES